MRSVFTRTCGGCDHATGQASFEAETYNQRRHREGARCRRTGLALASSASASTMPAASIPQSDNTSPNQGFFLGEEEMADVSLATFHLIDRENFGSGVQLARGCGGCGCGHGGGGCGGGRGCGGSGGGFGGFRGCGGGGFVGVRGCGGGGFVGVRACGGGGFVGVRGCGGCGFGIGFYDDIGFDDGGYGGWGFGGCAGCCGSWGACRVC